MSAAGFAALDAVGLNLQAVMELDQMPADIAARLRAEFDPHGRCRQLILIGNAGKTLWRAVQQAEAAADDPIDEFSMRAVRQWFAANCGDRHHVLIYPGECSVGLQSLGALAGWHHASPFMVGIMAHWGSWFGYRVALLADSRLAPTTPLQAPSPCDDCARRVCVSACPAGAMDGGAFVLDTCLAYRRRADSRCRATCIARLACPVGAEHRYDEAQIRHSYLRSLKVIGAA